MDSVLDDSLFVFAVVWQDRWSPLVVGLPSLLWIWNQHAQLHRLCKHHALTQSDTTGIKKYNRSTGQVKSRVELFEENI